MLLRITLLIISAFGLSIQKQFISRLISKLGFVVLIITLFISYSSITSNKNFFGDTLSLFEANGEGSDTRTFLYVEVLSDLNSENSLVFGKGANGTYYSPYFNSTKQDNDNRLTVEVGALAVLLKTGLVGLLTYIALLIIAIYQAFFKSRNNFVTGFGFFLLVYFVVFFFENLVSYSFYNILVWFSIGMCLSSEIRNLPESDLRNLLK
jgi:O-antigen ligase